MVEGPESKQTATGNYILQVGSGGTGVQQIGQAHLPPEPAPFQLPYDPPGFSGREDQITQLRALLEQAPADKNTTLRIANVAGMPGVGKSRLAIHVAHLLRDHFPSAQIYMNLRGEGDQEPKNPSDALATFLRWLGEDEDYIPPDLQGRAGLYRSRLAQRYPRSLVVLDNAHDVQQTEPLLPGIPSCAVLITSRRSMDTLPGAELYILAPMADAESIELIGELIGEQRVTSEPEAAEQIISLCGGLPLALVIAAGSLRRRRHRSLAQYAALLQAETLNTLEIDHLAVRATFGLAYRELNDAERRLFRLSALVPGPTFSLDVCAALLQQELGETQSLVERLEHAQLFQWQENEHYRLHDLLKLFGQEQAESENTAQERQTALERVTQWYESTSNSMADLLQWRFSPEEIHAIAAEAGSTAQAVTQNLFLQAVRWFDLELDNLVAVIDAMHRASNWSLVYKLAANLGQFFDLRRIHAVWRHVDELALDAAEKANDQLALRVILGHLGILYDADYRYEEAVDYYGRAVTIAHAVGDLSSEANITMNLANSYTSLGRWHEARECYRNARQIYRLLREWDALSAVFGNLGNLEYRQGLYHKAEPLYGEGLFIARRLRNRLREAQLLKNLGNVAAFLRRHDVARQRYDDALGILRELGDRHGEAETLIGLATSCAMQAQWEEARQYYQQAYGIADQLQSWVLRASIAHNFATVSASLDADDQARGLYQESLHISCALGDRRSEGKALIGLGLIEDKHKRASGARRLFEDARSRFPMGSPEHRYVTDLLANLNT